MKPLLDSGPCKRVCERLQWSLCKLGVLAEAFVIVLVIKHMCMR